VILHFFSDVALDNIFWHRDWLSPSIRRIGVSDHFDDLGEVDIGRNHRRNDVEEHAEDERELHTAANDSAVDEPQRNHCAANEDGDTRNPK
jgi:hypothetical protein